MLFLFHTYAQTIDTDVPVGWAVVPGYGMKGITGGENGETVTAKNAEELKSSKALIRKNEFLIRKYYLL